MYESHSTLLHTLDIHGSITNVGSAPPFSHATITTLPPSDPSLFLWPIDSLIDHCIVRPITLQSVSQWELTTLNVVHYSYMYFQVQACQQCPS